MAVLLPALSPGPAAHAAPAGDAPECAWRLTVSTHPDLDGISVFFPDTNAHYWADIRDLEPGEFLKGTASFPDARYTSLTTYQGGHVHDDIRDQDLVPDPGSQNPFAAPVPRPTDQAYTFYVGEWANQWPDGPAWIDEALGWALATGLATGNADGTFGPANPISRAESVNWHWKAAGSPTQGLTDHPWPDIPPWIDTAADWAHTTGLATGNADGTFGPANPISRAESVNWHWKAAGSPTQGLTDHPWPDIPPWIDTAADWAHTTGLATGNADGTFGPADPISRAESVNWHWKTAGSPSEGDNHLSAHVDGAAGGRAEMVHRIYLPDQTDLPIGSVPLPELTLFRGGQAHPLTECEGASGPTTAMESAMTAADEDARTAASVGVSDGPATGAPAVSGPATPAGPFALPNLADAAVYPTADNAYLRSANGQRPGDLIIVRGLAPTAPDTRGGEPPNDPAALTQLRYWSVCQSVVGNFGPTAGCAHDAEFPLDADGYFTAVISRASDRPSNATTADGVVWLPWGVDGETGDVTAVVYRHLIDNGMDGSIHDVPPGSTGDGGAGARAAMGDYYPETWWCPASTFESGGPGGGVDACLGP